MRRYRVRFAPKRETGKSPTKSQLVEFPQNDRYHQTQQRSRLGCRQCRTRKIKCDETYPICQRCEHRGLLCQPAPRPLRWQVEVPWMADSELPNLGPQLGQFSLGDNVKVNTRLMRYWLENMSQIMSVDPTNNPLSFPIVKYIQGTPSLVHVLQGVSAAHEGYFQPHNMSISLEERSKALSGFREELQAKNVSLSHSFLTLVMLGMSSSWMTTSPRDYGREHLLAARTVAKMITEKRETSTDELDHLSLGAYVYWDMACSFCLDPLDHSVEREDHLKKYVDQARYRAHTTTSHSIDLYYILGKVGQYCRSVADGKARDFEKETCFERELCNYNSIEKTVPAKSLTEAFRKHGLILLYRLCGVPGDTQPSDNITQDIEKKIRQLAHDIIRLILQIDSNSPDLNLHVIPLLSAGAEMTVLDMQERVEITKRLHAVYSTNRLLPTLWMLDLLQELWTIHNAGLTSVTWLDLMLAKGWRLRIG